MQWYLTNRQNAKDRRLRHTTNLAAPLTEDVVCFTVIGKPEKLLQLRASIQTCTEDKAESYFYENDYSPGWYWLTIHPQRATKAQAIQTLVRTYGLEECRLVVFGDQVNDIQMFQAADHPVAVANAVDELKRHATEIIGSNTEDGVVRYIEKNWKT
jgi:hydroxymethylpyrimidine pyrophosphatase-like HAD family hydrolase